MRKYLWPISVVAFALLLAGAWVAFPRERADVLSAVSSFCSRFVAETRAAWGRMMAKDSAAEEPAMPLEDLADADIVPAVATSLKSIADPVSDPEPSSLTPEQRRKRYDELVAAANVRKLEVMRSNLMKCPDGEEALKVTRAYRAKADEMKRLEEKYGATDDRVALIRIEMVALKEAVQVANARYKMWKDAHPSEVTDPLADKIYCDLIARSRFFRD